MSLSWYISLVLFYTRCSCRQQAVCRSEDLSTQVNTIMDFRTTFNNFIRLKSSEVRSTLSSEYFLLHWLNPALVYCCFVLGIFRSTPTSEYSAWRRDLAAHVVGLHRQEYRWSYLCKVYCCFFLGIFRSTPTSEYFCLKKGLSRARCWSSSSSAPLIGSGICLYLPLQGLLLLVACFFPGIFRRP